MGRETKVKELPDCQFCDDEIHQAPPAQYDFKTLHGPWAYGCEKCWVTHRMFEDLGTGKGQKLVVD